MTLGSAVAFWLVNVSSVLLVIDMKRII